MPHKYSVALLLAGAILLHPSFTTSQDIPATVVPHKETSLSITKPIKVTKVTSRADEQSNIEIEVRAEMDLVKKYFGSQYSVAYAVLVTDNWPLDENNVKCAYRVYRRYGWKAWSSYTTNAYRDMLD